MRARMSRSGCGISRGGRIAARDRKTGPARAATADGHVTGLDQIFRAVENAAQHFGRLDILVNNAGVAPENLAENVREEDYDLTVGINLKGTFFASQAAGRVMIRQKSGRIINMSSQAGFVALPTESVYCMTKAAIAHLTKCLAVEWGQVQYSGECGGAYVYPHSGDRGRRWPIPRFAPTWWNGLPRCIALESRWRWRARLCSWRRPRHH